MKKAEYENIKSKCEPKLELIKKEVAKYESLEDFIKNQNLVEIHDEILEEGKLTVDYLTDAGVENYIIEGTLSEKDGKVNPINLEDITVLNEEGLRIKIEG